MNSMTGFGRGSAGNDDLKVSVEITSVNRRNLEISTSLPKDWIVYERFISDIVRKKANRGKFHVSLRLEEFSGQDEFNWSQSAAENTLNGLKTWAESHQIPFQADASLLFHIACNHRETVELPDAESAQSIVEEALTAALDELLEMRAREGQALFEDLNQRVENLQSWLDQISEKSTDTVAYYRDVLFQRLRNAGLEIDLDDERVLKEIALFADRCDISEEITRLSSHLNQLRETTTASGLIGRKLEFLVQEVNREFNTIGSKANNIEVGKCVIESKNELERVREQILNVE